MLRGGRAPWSRSEDRCDGAGSEADVARPPVKAGPMLPAPGALVFADESALVRPLSSGFRIDQARSWPGGFCPAFQTGFQPRTGEDSGENDSAALSAPVKQKIARHGAAGVLHRVGRSGFERCGRFSGSEINLDCCAVAQRQVRNAVAIEIARCSAVDARWRGGLHPVLQDSFTVVEEDRVKSTKPRRLGEESSKDPIVRV